MGAKGRSKWWFRPERRHLLNGVKQATISEESGVPRTTVSGVMNGERAAPAELIAVILKYCQGFSQEQLFAESKTPPANTRGRTATDWHQEATLLRGRLAQRGDAYVDMDFLGFDGAFLRAILAPDVMDIGVLSPCPHRIGTLRVAFVALEVLRGLRAAGLISQGAVAVATEYAEALKHRASIPRSDGGSIKVVASWRQQLPCFCAARIGDMIMWGELGLDVTGATPRLTVLDVRVCTKEEQRDEFERVRDRLEGALREQ